jgi:hypothetical protein
MLRDLPGGQGGIASDCFANAVEKKVPAEARG